MAFTKNPLQDGTKTKLKDYSVDLENRIGNEFARIPTETTWLSLTTIIGSGFIKCARDTAGNIHFKIEITVNNNVSGGSDICLLPTAYRPTENIIITRGNSVSFNTNGRVTFIGSQGVTSLREYYIFR